MGAGTAILVVVIVLAGLLIFSGPLMSAIGNFVPGANGGINGWIDNFGK